MVLFPGMLLFLCFRRVDRELKFDIELMLEVRLLEWDSEFGESGGDDEITDGNDQEDRIVLYCSSRLLDVDREEDDEEGGKDEDAVRRDSKLTLQANINTLKDEGIVAVSSFVDINFIETMKGCLGLELGLEDPRRFL